MNSGSSPSIASCLLALPRDGTDPEIEGLLNLSPRGTCVLIRDMTTQPATSSSLAGYLNTSTVHDNYQHGQPVKDGVYGNVNANDWFFAGVNDVIKGKDKNDVVTTIS